MRIPIPLALRSVAHIAALASETEHWPRDCFKRNHMRTVGACLDALGLETARDLPPFYREKYSATGVTSANKAALLIFIVALQRNPSYGKQLLQSLRPWPLAVMVIRAELCALAYLRQCDKPPSILEVESLLRKMPARVQNWLPLLSILRLSRLSQVIKLAAKEAHKAYA